MHFKYGKVFTERICYRYDTYEKKVRVYTGPEGPGSTPNRPVMQCPDDWPKAKAMFLENSRPMPDDELVAARMTTKNATIQAREYQAIAAGRLGYVGPVGSGEARALKRFMTELGRPDAVRHSYTSATVHNKYFCLIGNPSTRFRDYDCKYCQTKLAGPHYVFKSPIEGVDFTVFMKAVRLYKPSEGGARKAIQRAFANPETLAEDALSMQTISALLNLGVGDTVKDGG